MFWRRVQQPEEAEKEQPTAGSSDGSSSVEVEEQQEAALKMLPIKASVGGVTRRFCVRKALGLVELREEMDTYFGDNMPESIFHFEFMDDEGDWCTAETEAEWREAKRLFEGSGLSCLKVRIVEGDTRSLARASRGACCESSSSTTTSRLSPTLDVGVQCLQGIRERMPTHGDYTVEADLLPDGSLHIAREYAGLPRSDGEDVQRKEEEEEEEEEEYSADLRLATQLSVEDSMAEAARLEYAHQEEECGTVCATATPQPESQSQSQTLEREEEKKEEWVVVEAVPDEEVQAPVELKEDDMSSMSSMDTPPTLTHTNVMSQSFSTILPLARLVTEVAHKDGDITTCGQWFTKTWRMSNPPNSGLAWPAECYMCLVDGEKLEGATNVQITCPVPLAPGQTADFSVRIRTPQTPGLHKSIFRLFTPDGMPFGPRQFLRVNAAPQVELSTPTGSSSAASTSTSTSAPEVVEEQEEKHEKKTDVEEEKHEEPAVEETQEEETVEVPEVVDPQVSSAVPPPAEPEPEVVVEPAPEPAVPEPELELSENESMLVGMGFHPMMVRFAMEQFGDNLDAALDKLIELSSSMRPHQ